MNNEELRKRMAALFAEYGGPIAQFIEAVTEWAAAEDLTADLPDYQSAPAHED